MQLQALVKFINQHYLSDFNTELLGGYKEPFYQPASDKAPAQIQFTQDYLRSALHELAHWCIAGEQRRQQPDYGYWYAPDGRDAEQQKAFYQSEVKPQAVEMAFSRVCGVAFEVSADNLNNQFSDELPGFILNVEQQFYTYVNNGFPVRAGQLLEMLFTWRYGEGDVYAWLDSNIN